MFDGKTDDNPRKPDAWSDWFVSWVKKIAFVVTTGAGALITLGAVVILASELLAQSIVVESFQADLNTSEKTNPKSVFSSLLGSSLRQYHKDARSFKNASAFFDVNNASEFDIKINDISVLSLAIELRRAIGFPRRTISVVLDCPAAGCEDTRAALSLHFRSYGQLQTRQLNCEFNAKYGLSQCLNDAAEKVWEMVDPYIAAFTMFRRGDIEEARHLSFKIISSQLPNKEWAANLLCLIFQRDGNFARKAGDGPRAAILYARAISWCDQALSYNPDYSVAYLNRGNTLIDAANLSSFSGQLKQISPQKKAKIRSSKADLALNVACLQSTHVIAALSQNHVYGWHVNSQDQFITLNDCYGEAFSAYRAAIKLRQYPAPHRRLASAYRKRGVMIEELFGRHRSSFRRADEIFRQGIKIFPRDALGYADYGRFLSRMLSSYRTVTKERPRRYCEILIGQAPKIFSDEQPKSYRFCIDLHERAMLANFQIAIRLNPQNRAVWKRAKKSTGKQFCAHFHSVDHCADAALCETNIGENGLISCY